MENWMEYFNEHQGNKCQCGKEKTPNQAFCDPCFHKLPFNLKTDIYIETGMSYCKAYDKAITFLNK